MNIIGDELEGIGKFIMDQNIIQLGIAFIIALGLNQVITSFVDDIFSPMVLLAFGQDNIQSMGELYITIYDVRIRYGSFLVALIKFTLMVVIIYYIIVVALHYKGKSPPKKII